LLAAGNFVDRCSQI